MHRKLFVSAGAVIALSVISIVAFANSFHEPETGAEEPTATPTVIMTECPEVTHSEVPDIKAEEPIAVTLEPTTGTPEPTAKAAASMAKSRHLDADESYLLAKLAMAEAEGEDTEGKALVILVALNRVWSDEFPDSISKVIYQKNQFSPVSNGRFDSVEPNADCYKALEMVQIDGWDESQGALYFESESASTWHKDNLKFLFQHGNHMFYTDKED